MTVHKCSRRHRLSEVFAGPAQHKPETGMRLEEGVSDLRKGTMDDKLWMGRKLMLVASSGSASRA